MDYVNNTLDIKEINNKKENKEMYKVKNIIESNGEDLQREVKEWIESRNHIQIISVNIWSYHSQSYATITYREVQYIG